MLNMDSKLDCYYQCWFSIKRFLNVAQCCLLGLIRPLILIPNERYLICWVLFFLVAQYELVGAPAPTERVLGRLYYWF
jgi:hypothetical protein